MSDEHVNRRTPRRPVAALLDLTWLVIVPGDPAAARAFTDSEHDEARAYAQATGGELKRMP